MQTTRQEKAEKQAARRRRLIWLRDHFLEQARLAREAGFPLQEDRMLRNAWDYGRRCEG